VYFRNQDITLEQQHKLTEHYGIQNTDLNQENDKHVTIIGRPATVRAPRTFFEKDINEYHADVSYDINQGSYTFLRMTKVPPSGGDTLYLSQYAAYATLSQPIKDLIDNLTAIHSSRRAYISGLEYGAKPRRHGIDTEHPLVISHPVTKLRALNYNHTFVEKIPQLNVVESEYLTKLLNYHQRTADDFSFRLKWEPGTVAVWDNRIVAHKAIQGHYDVNLREGNRTAVFASRPKFDRDSEDIFQRQERVAKEIAGLNGKYSKISLNEGWFCSGEKR